MVEVHGTCEPGFEPVQDAFVANFEQGLELGACAAVTVDGRSVVDIWAGDADQHGRPWDADTIINVYSTTKTMAATCVLMLVDRGDLDLDASVATYWPEFAANGKEGVLLRHVLGHTAGVPGFDPPLAPTDLYDWDAVCANLAAQSPWWEPGSVSGYHAVTQGFLEGEVVRRVTGRSVGTFFREEVAEPLGADFYIGLPASEDGRVAELVPPDMGIAQGELDPSSVGARVLLSCPLDGTEPSTRAWRNAEIPAAGGTGNARSVARVHSALACGGEVDGVRLLSAEGVERIQTVQHFDDDLVLGTKMRLGTGFGLISEATPLSQNPRSFFWGGWGGSLAMVDPDAHLSVAYVMNRMASGLVGDLRGAMVVLAAGAAVAAG